MQTEAEIGGYGIAVTAIIMEDFADDLKNYCEIRTILKTVTGLAHHPNCPIFHTQTSFL